MTGIEFFPSSQSVYNKTTKFTFSFVCGHSKHKILFILYKKRRTRQIIKHFEFSEDFFFVNFFMARNIVFWVTRLWTRSVWEAWAKQGSKGVREHSPVVLGPYVEGNFPYKRFRVGLVANFLTKTRKLSKIMILYSFGR